MEGKESKIEVLINPNEVISAISTDGIKKEFPTACYAYPTQIGATLSGLYIFNPIRDADR
jgi:hypothetical protein